MSAPYVTMTLKMMEEWGNLVQTTSPGRFVIRGGGRRYGILESEVEADASAASYFLEPLLLLAAVLQSRSPKDSRSDDFCKVISILCIY